MSLNKRREMLAIKKKGIKNNECEATFKFRKSTRITEAAFIPDGMKCTLTKDDHIPVRNGSTITSIHRNNSLAWVNTESI